MGKALPLNKWQSDGVALYTGDARTVLSSMAAGTVQTVITSPPYWGLRKYAAEDQIGLEDTPEEHIAALVEVFRAVRRVLRDDGTVWLNYGDAYHTSGGVGANRYFDGRHNEYGPGNAPMRTSLPELKQGDILGLPWRVAFALREDGWYLRSAIVWAKGISFCDTYAGSVMPESVNGWRWERCKTQTWPDADVDSNEELRRDRQTGRDFGKPQTVPCPGCEKCKDTGGYVLRKGSWRPTSAYEHVFLLAKNRKYFCDAERVREPSVDPEGTAKRYEHPFHVGDKESQGAGRPDGASNTGGMKSWSGGCNPRNVWTIEEDEWAEFLQFREWKRAQAAKEITDVFCIGTAQCKEAHFATFPETLVEPCIQAGTPKHACGECGAPWAPVVERRVASPGQQPGYMRDCTLRNDGERAGSFTDGYSKVQAYAPTCEHEDKSGRPLVLDPFSGTGTVGVVALKHGCRYVGIDISEKYNEMARLRLRKTITGVDREDQTALFEDAGE